MRCHRYTWIVVATLIVSAFSSIAAADVSLTISDNDATPGSGFIQPDGKFSFTVRMVVTGSDLVSGLDYYLTTPDLSGSFDIFDRNTAGGAFNDPLFFDDTTVEGSPSSILNPRNDHDLGGLSAGSKGAGTHLVAIYTLERIGTPPPNGYFTIETTSNANEGWIDPSSGEHMFTSHGSYTIFVPEPASGVGIAALALGAVSRRRRR